MGCMSLWVCVLTTRKDKIYLCYHIRKCKIYAERERERERERPKSTGEGF